MIFADASQQEWAAATEQLELADGFDIVSEDIRNAIDTSWAAQATVPLPVDLEDVSTPLCNPFEHSHGGIAYNGGSAKSQKPLDVWGTQMESVPVGTSDTAQLDIQLNSGDVGVAVQECPPDDGASLALWEASRSEESTSAPATDHLTSSSRFLETDGPNLPLHTGLSPVSLSTDSAPDDKCAIDEEYWVHQPELSDDRERNSAGPTLIERFLVEQDLTSRASCDTYADTAPSEGSTCDRAHSSHSTNTADAADPEGSDDDEPPLTTRRRRTVLHTRGSRSPSPPRTPRSRADSIDVEPTAALRGRKRLRRRKGVRRDSLAPETDDTSASSTTSRSHREGERWPVQCFVERKTIGSQEVMTIQVPTIDLYARSNRRLSLSPSDDTSQTMPILGAVCRSRRRARFSPDEEDLLVELKEQREPRLSWREIQRRFPQRTIGSLQVHYSTHLKRRGPSERRACRRS